MREAVAVERSSDKPHNNDTAGERIPYRGKSLPTNPPEGFVLNT